MNSYQAQRMAGQHEADMRRLAAASGHSNRAWQARRDHSRAAHPMRRRAGWALISLGMRLAYTAGEE